MKNSTKNGENTAEDVLMTLNELVPEIMSYSLSISTLVSLSRYFPPSHSSPLFSKIGRSKAILRGKKQLHKGGLQPQ